MDTVQTLADNIRTLRGQTGLTQEALAARLSLSFQAVSKWENAQSAPDVTLLPELADIFGVSMDVLFGREALLPWSDDETLHLVAFRGHCMLESGDGSSRLMFSLDGDVRDVDCCGGNLEIHGNVEGNVTANGRLTCDHVGGSANVSGGVNCGNIGGNASAHEIHCHTVKGDVDAENVYYDQ